MDRRDFLKWSLNIGALSLLQTAGFGCSSKRSSTSAVVLPDLPYEPNALEPYISKETVALHYGKHHQSYVEKANRLIAGTPHEKQSLEKIIINSAEKGQTAIFNNAAQAFNHEFYWNGIDPKGGGKPSGAIQESINKSFGGYDQFADAFFQSAMSQFGSGWTWLIAEGDKLTIMNTSNADTPIASGKKPLITLDLWEHAYYLDYQNKRGEYIQAFLTHLVNWSFAEVNLASALKAS
jgi:superoxide dismutase, Fe-Mn family